jgi:hypothetical protein
MSQNQRRAAPAIDPTKKRHCSRCPLAILGFVAPTISAAEAETVVIKRHYDNGWHRGWHGDMGSRRVFIERHDRGFHRGFDRY